MIFSAAFSSKALSDVQRVLRTWFLRTEDSSMTTDEKNRISELRKQGCTYAKIAEILSIPESTIKTFCRRTRLNGDADEVKPVCKQCGQPITVKAKCKPRQFCSDKCRAAWWFSNHSNMPKVKYHLTCACCGKAFVSIGNKARKYCSHECYITARFGGSSNN